ncbi:DUF5686 and carboxypeptidase regulatory-like domain-containing protein [Mangrovivirga cuniculi]|uniref:CarboxypepD_reg-like domain-containing protein n=1 Tax=Mangrovivirga cuniculi TaxID=2715131 RepID=A0A4D7JEA8_9BACT|nr:DUF5686 and carboxypeptidase regulatory-like domain-containing protein [Mangrovivirga cuniculi]QCK14011.1 hypothetical protein DCC35_04210 [Mangrovivirga cuniculi]
MNKTSSLIIVFLFLAHLGIQSQTLKGTIKDQQNNLLGFTAVYVEETNNGTTSNEKGEFEINLPPGNYHVSFQYMGFKSKTISVSLSEGETKEIGVNLEAQIYNLPELEVTGSFEDPAYAIIRKASAKAKYHLQQVDEYTARVYLKGKGKFDKIPGIIKRRLEKEGLNQDQLYIGESIVKITYKRPSTYEQEVIAVRSKGDSQDFSPGQYIFGSFYEESIAGIISPLSRKCFSHYKYEFQGLFEENGYVVNKIKVIPRVKDSELFNGHVYIVEDLWNLHSVDLTTTQSGININIQQNLAPVRENVWLPVTHRFFVSGSFVGFEFSYNYLAGVSDYNVKINEELARTVKVIDEKTETAKVETIENERSEIKGDSAVFTVSKLKEDIETYVEEEKKESGNPKILERIVVEDDNSLKTVDKNYWDDIRTIPLTEAEIKGYQKLDSTVAVMDSVSARDSVNAKKLSPFFLLTGDYLRFKNGNSLKIGGPLFNTFYNTVNGWNISMPITYTVKTRNDNKWKLDPTFRYNFASENFQIKGGLQWSNDDRDSTLTFGIEGGYFVDQINNEEPISPLINSISTLFWRGNFMKLYDKKYVDFSIYKNFVHSLKIRFTIGWEHRQQLQNNTDYTFNGRVNKEYSSNLPQNMYLENTSFPNHQIFYHQGEVSFVPGLRYNMYNDRLIPLDDKKPEFRLNWKGTLPVDKLNDLDFLKTSVGVRHKIVPAANLSILYNLEVGGFLYKDSLSFIDYNHFNGNQTPFLPFEPSGSYNFLDYYEWSTDEPYLSGMVKLSFRQLLFTQLTELRLIGMKEYFFFNNLTHANGNNYFEAGYGITNVFRILRLEVGGGFDNFNNTYWGIRIGISADLF